MLNDRALRASDCIPVTPSDTVKLGYTAQALRANGAGNVVCVTEAGTTRTLPFLAGETRLIGVVWVKDTNTTATGIEAYV